MLLKEIYDRKIDRDINPAVVVSDKKKETIKAEIEEYVFTDELIEKLYHNNRYCFKQTFWQVRNLGKWLLRFRKISFYKVCSLFIGHEYF